MHVVDHSFDTNEATLINFGKYAEYSKLMHAICQYKHGMLKRPISLAREKFANISPYF